MFADLLQFLLQQSGHLVQLRLPAPEPLQLVLELVDLVAGPLTHALGTLHAGMDLPLPGQGTDQHQQDAGHTQFQHTQDEKRQPTHC